MPAELYFEGKTDHKKRRKDGKSTKGWFLGRIPVGANHLHSIGFSYFVPEFSECFGVCIADFKFSKT
jgi:hypothetical protein